MSQARRKRIDHHRRGGVYVAVLGVAMIVMVLGTSALLAVRVQTRIAVIEQDAIKADSYAQSMADLAQWRLSRQPLWRAVYPHDTWSAGENNGEGVLSFKLLDEEDGNLLDNSAQPVRLFARATVGKAVRIYSVSLQPLNPLSASVLVNPGFENGTGSWSGQGCTIEQSTSNFRSGSASLRAFSRSAAWAGPVQDVTGSISNGQNYTTEVWVRMSSGSASVRVTLRTTTLLVTSYHGMTPWTTVGTSWTRVSGTATPWWIGTLSSAALYVETQSGTGAFFVDDFNFYRTGQGEVAFTPVAGSWRQEMLP